MMWAQKNQGQWRLFRLRGEKIEIFVSGAWFPRYRVKNYIDSSEERIKAYVKAYVETKVSKGKAFIIERFPSEAALNLWVLDSVAEAIDGCLVEPDGVCPHGAPSWLLVLGLV